MKNILSASLVVILVSLNSCSDDSESVNFDRGPLLENLVDNIILPAYIDWDSRNQSLLQSVDTFINNRSVSSLTDTKVKWQEARIAWKKAEPYNFGPIDSRFLNKAIDIFPVSEVGIDNAVADFNGNDNYLDFVGSDKKGLGSMEYLLFSRAEDETLTFFENSNQQEFLRLLATEQKLNSDIILNDWQSGYAEQFKNNTGNDAGASITLYTNSMIELIEIIKNFKIATPLGLRTNSNPIPDLVESPHAKISTKLIIENLHAIEDIFLGKQGVGLDDYLDALGINDDNGLLSVAILSKIDECQTIANDIGELQSAINSGSPVLDDFLVAIQELTTLMKSDMMSQLGLIITFSSNDGD